MSARNVAELLDSLRSRGASLRVEDGKILVKPRKLVTPEELAELREGKAEALRLLQAPSGNGPAGEPLAGEAPPAPRSIRVHNPTRAPLCRTPGCYRLDAPMLRTVRRLPAWICPGCWATCAVSGEDSPADGSAGDGGRGRLDMRPGVRGCGSDPAAALAVPGAEVSSAGVTTTGPAAGVPALDGSGSGLGAGAAELLGEGGATGPAAGGDAEESEGRTA